MEYDGTRHFAEPLRFNIEEDTFPNFVLTGD